MLAEVTHVHLSDRFVSRLDATPRALIPLLAGLSTDEERWRPAPAAWSLREIVGHLGDEELDDFPPRLRSTLEDPTRPWPAIDPEGWVRERGHQERSLEELLERFSTARRASLTWLKTLGDAPWDHRHAHPTLGVLRAGDLLVSWATHDPLHLRQLAARLHGLAERAGAPYSGRYAGPWAAASP